MKYLMVSILLLFLVFLHSQNVVINEIFYDPAGTDTGYEWIEFYNTGELTIDLSGWMIRKAGTQFVYSFELLSGYSIEPHSYFLIGEQFVPNADLYENLAFQNGGSETDGIRLVSPDLQYTDTVLYDSPNTNELPDDISNPGEFFAPDVSSGNSLARKHDGEDTGNSEIDFFECTEPTPGNENFYPIDLAVFYLTITQTQDDYWIETKVHNLSTEHVDNSAATLIVHLNNSLLGTYDLPELPPEDSTFVSYNIGELLNNYNVVSIEVIYQYDNNLENNSAANSILIGESPIILNELMFKPESNNQEWIEIFNRTDCAYCVDNFQITDASGGNISLYGTIVENDFLVFCEDRIHLLNTYENIDPDKVIETENWTSLNNTNESLTLTDGFNTLLDSTFYSGNNCPTNFSLERVNPFDDENIVWEICLDESGGTPTLPNSVLPLQKDLALEFLEVSINSNIEHLIIIRNIGFENIETALVECSYVLNGTYPAELVYSQTIVLTDSLLFSFNTSSPPAGYITYKYEVISSEDLNNENNRENGFLNNDSFPFVINEIMYDPFEDEPEWLEIKLNYFIPDLENILIVIDDDTLHIPNTNNEFLILTDSEEDVQFLLDHYQLEIPVLAGLGNLSNSGENISVLDQQQNLIENFYYEPQWNNNTDATSIERKNPFSHPAMENWGASQTTCTPGMQNSILPVDKDLKMSFIGYEISNTRIIHSIQIENVGIEQIHNATVSCYSLLNDIEQIVEIWQNEIDLGNSLTINFESEIPSLGYTTFIYEVYSAEDLNEINNVDFSFYNNNYLPFVVNEIMYDPENEPEWIEIKINDSISNLAEFYITIDDDTLQIPFSANEYILITGSQEDIDSLNVLYNISEIPIYSALPSLSNNGETISIFDKCGNLIEVFSYLPEWNDDLDGVSIERVNSRLPADISNWGPSVTQATPGKENSIFVQLLPQSSKLAIQPNPFSPYLAERTIISFELPEKLSTVTLRIFDLKGRMVKKLINQELQASSGEIICNGKDKNNKILPIGIYIVLMQATSRESEKVYQKKTTVVIAK